MKVTQSAFLQDIKNRFTFYPPVTDEQKQNHEIVNAVFIDAAVKLSQICPQSPELDMAINHLALSRAMANASLAIYENSKHHQDEDDGINRDADDVFIEQDFKEVVAEYTAKQQGVEKNV